MHRIVLQYGSSQIFGKQNEFGLESIEPKTSLLKMGLGVCQGKKTINLGAQSRPDVSQITVCQVCVNFQNIQCCKTE